MKMNPRIYLQLTAALVALASSIQNLPANMVVAWGSGNGGGNYPDGLTGVTAVTRDLALMTDCTLFAWGNNDWAQRNIPSGLGPVMAIADGYGHRLALKTNGTVVAWGAGLTDSGDWWNYAYGQSIVPAGLTNVIAIVAGLRHSVALRSNGTVVAWGFNYYGETNVPPGLTNVVAISAELGGDHTLALKSDGTVVAWGYGYLGETNIPSGLTNVISIAAGSHHNLALKSEGTVVGWGANGSHQTDIPAGLSNVIAIAAGADYSMALKADHTVVAWGENFSGQTNVPNGLTNVFAISAGGAKGMVIYDGSPFFKIIPQSGSRYSGWPYSFSVAVTGQEPLTYQWMFNGTNISNANGPTLNFASLYITNAGTYSVLVSNSVGSILSPTATLVVSNVAPIITSQPQPTDQSLPSGWGTSFTATAGGSLPLTLQWRRNGTNIVGQNYEYSLWDQRVTYLMLDNIQVVDSGSYDVVASNLFGVVTSSSATLVVSNLAPVITEPPTNQTVPRWGSAVFSVTVNGSYPLGFQWQFNGADIPNATDQNLSLDYVNFSNVGSYAVIVSNAYGSNTSSSATLTVLPQSVVVWGDNSYGQRDVPSGLSNLVAIAAGAYHGLALKNDGTVATWGAKSLYGYPGSNVTNVPVDLSNVVAIAAGMSHSLALRGDGTVVAWGDNYSGQINVPNGLTDVVAIAAGENHSLALKNDGTVFGWGYTNYATAPTGLSNVVAIAAGSSQSLALTRSGTVVAWGYELQNQQTVLPTLTNVVAIAAGYSHSLALRNDGTVIAWGSSYYGYSGPVTPPDSLSNVVAIAAGGGYSGDHSVALKDDGTVVAWGWNSQGQTNVPAGVLNGIAVSAGGFFSMALIAGEPPILHASLMNPQWNGYRFSISLPTQCGHVYGMEYKDSLSNSNWLPLRLVAGNGQLQTFIDKTASDNQRFYRVRKW